MKIGILSDAHSNPHGLNICLEVLKKSGVNKIIYLGDSIGYFGQPGPVLKKLQSVNAICLMGNHEAMLLGYMKYNRAKEKIYKIKENANKISRSQLKRIAIWLPFYEERTGGHRILYVHGSPWNPIDGYVYPDDNLGRFPFLPYDAIFMGHTHRPFMSKVNNVLVVNVGSCGLPRDQGNMLSCSIYDTNQRSCEIIRLPINVNYILQQQKNIHPSVVARLKYKSDKKPLGPRIGLGAD